MDDLYALCNNYSRLQRGMAICRLDAALDIPEGGTDIGTAGPDSVIFFSLQVDFAGALV